MAGPLAIRDRAVLVADALVIADLHLGRGAAGGLQLPVGGSGDMLDRFEALVEATDPGRIVIAGDLLHSFGTVPRPVERTIAGLRARAGDVPIVVTPGNHDTMLETVWDGPTETAVRVGETLICHGHEPPAADAERYVIGHDHPTLAIEGQRRPCVLVGEGVFRGSDVVMLPAFNRLLRGVAVNHMAASDFQSPLVTDADALAPVVWDERARSPRRFPTLGAMRHRL